MSESTSARKPQTEFIDIKLRIKNDGGPMFAFLSSIQDPYARGDRLRQLAYLGMLAERGVMGFPHAITARTVSSPPREAAPVSSSDVQVGADSTSVETLFEPGDLATIFGRN